jgi:hypothetical protein
MRHNLMRLSILLEYNVSAVTCDYTGVGKPFDRLRAAVGVIHIIEHPFSTLVNQICG